MLDWMKSTAGAAVLAGALLTGWSAPADAGLLKVGVLTCDIRDGVGMVFHSRKDVRCRFAPTKAGRRERYRGAFSKYGLDLGETDGGTLVWVVFAVGGYSRYALAGDYAGAGADVSIGIGAGAHALIGGFQDSIVLQPVSVQGQTGYNVAAGLATLHLERR